MLIRELTRFDSFYIFSTELLVILICSQTDKEFRLLDPVLSMLKFIIDIGCIGNIDFTNRESSLAKWLERRPLDPGVMSSNPGVYIFLIKDYFFISLSFFFSQF